jgi:hypothetical protein
MRFNALSQSFPRTVVLGVDTCVAFTLDQSKKMAKWNEEKKENMKLLDLCSKQIVLMDSIILTKENQVNKMSLINRNFKDIIKQKDEILLLTEVEKKSLSHDIKIQKRQKWISIGVGTVLTTILTIIAIR